MSARFTATSAVRGASVELAASLSREFAAAPPALRVLRRRDQPPDSPAPGFVLFDSDRQFADLAAPAGFARRRRGYINDGRSDGGMWEFDLWESHPDDSDVDTLQQHPIAVHIDYWAGGVLKQFRVTGLTGSHTTVQQNNNTVLTTIGYYKGDQLFQAKWQRTVGQPGGTFWWVDDNDVHSPPIGFESEEVWDARLETSDLGSGQYEATFAWKRGTDVVLSGVVRHLVNPADGGWQLDVSLLDSAPTVALAAPGLDSESYYYYSAYVDPSPGPGGPTYPLPPAAPTATGSAVATRRQDGPERLYGGLAAIHRNYDEPSPQEFGKGQLRRFLSPFGAAYDHARGMTEALALRHDPLRIGMDHLAALGRGLGWDVDRTTPGQIQRNDLVFASEIFERVGTVDSVKALLLRALPDGWSFTIHEYAANVFLLDGGTNHRWDVWRGTTTTINNVVQAKGYANPTPGRMAGRPAGAFTPGGTEWMFWHDHSSGRRELWYRLPNMGTPDARVMANTADNQPGIAYTDESPAAVVEGTVMRLVWSSDRGGTWSIWTRTIMFDINGMPVVPAQNAEQVSDDFGDDRSPAVVKEAGLNGRLWVFWASNRRGRSDIWARTRRWDADAEEWVWDPARRLTTAALGDHAPAAVRAGDGKIHLFWSSTTRAGARLFESVLTTVDDQDTWSAPVEVAPGPERFRDESPAALLYQNKLRLYWHSDRHGKWQIWTSTREQNGWSAPERVVHDFLAPGAAKRTVDAKEPGVAVPPSGAYVSTYWRAQLLGERYTSRTFDTADADAKAALTSVDDWNHYTYDSGRTPTSRVAYDTVGVHFTVPNDFPGDLTKEVERIRAFVETYRPATVRIVWLDGLTPIM